MQYTSRKDIQDLLELLNTTNDIEIQAKIFLLFGCYLVSGKSTNSDLIITSHFVYDKIYAVLSKGLPKKVTVTLNFVAALLLEADDDACTTRQSLVLHARNMLRVSGCLVLLSNLFTSCMVHQETWTALCRCLTEICRNSQENQDYCSDLIPTGIRRCATGDIESYQVLQSLLQKHDRNTQHFIESNGLAIFTRDKLHYTSCLKLVNAVAQNSTAVVLLVHKTEVVTIVRNFLNLYGKESQIGQWATIILYNIKTFIKDLDLVSEEPKDDRNKVDYRFCVNNDSMTDNKTSHGDTTKLFQKVYREMLQCQKEDLCSIAPLVGTHAEAAVNTGKYSRNKKTVMESAILSARIWPNGSSMTQQSKPVITPNKKYYGIAPRTIKGDLSFSFLEESLNKNRISRNLTIFNTASFNSDKENTCFVSNTNVDIKRNVELNNEYTKSYYNITKLIENVEDTDRTLEFKPTIVSTPKRFSNKQRINKFKKNERRINQDTFKPRKTAKVKNKSFSGKLFSAINDSCTILVKTVKNIFTTKKVDDTTATKKDESSIVNSAKKPHSNYSFMDYMRRRDDIVGSQWGSDLSTEKKSGSSCETCNNTVLLKHKLEKDDQLKQTLKKLKFGINLYGCDFKKISSTMWPRDSYMTPTVLYNLYRKLIVK